MKLNLKLGGKSPLLGIVAGIPDDLYDDYNATGTSHIIVIKGSLFERVGVPLCAGIGSVRAKRGI